MAGAGLPFFAAVQHRRCCGVSALQPDLLAEHARGVSKAQQPYSLPLCIWKIPFENIDTPPASFPRFGLPARGGSTPITTPTPTVARRGCWFPGRANRRGQQRFTFRALAGSRPGPRSRAGQAGEAGRQGNGDSFAKNARDAGINVAPSPIAAPFARRLLRKRGDTARQPARQVCPGVQTPTAGPPDLSWDADPNSQVALQAAAP